MHEQNNNMQILGLGSTFDYREKAFAVCNLTGLLLCSLNNIKSECEPEKKTQNDAKCNVRRSFLLN